jgi:hypothetical protein
MYNQCIFLREFYQEKENVVLDYGDNKIDLNKLHKIAHDLPVQKNLDVKKVNFNSMEDHIGTKDKTQIKKHEERIQRADTSIPVLVSMGDNGKYNLLDGWHRLSKAEKTGTTVDYKVVPPDKLKLAFKK